MAIEIWTVYDHPIDYPNKFVARKFNDEKPTLEIIKSKSLDELRERLEDMGLMAFGVSNDDPTIIETWM